MRERTNSDGINQRALCRARLKLDDRASARMHAYVRPKRTAYFDGDLCPYRAGKVAATIVFALRGIVGRNFVGAYKCVRPREVTDILGLQRGLDRPSRIYPGAAAHLLIVRLSVSSLKQLNFALERAIGQIARGDEKNTSHTVRDII